MANYTCNVNDLLVLAKCFSDKCMGQSDRNAIIIYARMKALAALGGTDYSANVKQLMIDSANWRKRAPDEIKAIDVYEALQNATNNGASVSANASTLATAATCLSGMCIGDRDQQGVLAFLKCSIETNGDAPS
jgi:hypothetical protein